MIVVELERPPAGLEIRTAHRPVALDPDFLGQQPVGGPDQPGVVGRHTGVRERDDRQRGVPDGRLACLEAADLSIVDEEPLDAVEPLLHGRVVGLVSAKGERHQRVDPRRLDPAPRAVVLLAVQYPALDALHRAAPQRLQRPPLIEAPHGIHPQEHAPAERPWLGLHGAPGAQLVQVERQRTDGALGADDRQRGDRLARPAGEVVDVERKPGWEEDQLGRQGRHVLPGPEPEECEPDVSEHAGVLDAPRGEHRFARRDHVALVGRIAGQPQGGVGLDRRGGVGGRAVEVRPASVAALLRADPVGCALCDPCIADAQELAKQQIFGIHGDVRLQFRLPPSGGVLEVHQMAPAALQSVVQRLGAEGTGRRLVY